MLQDSDIKKYTRKSKKERIVEELRRIRWVDKYHTFRNLIPEATTTPESEQDIIINLVEDCCTALIKLYKPKKLPNKKAITSVILKYMDKISYADVNVENKDFGYELCWYIAEKTECNIKKYTNTKVYGYWSVENGKIKPVTRRGKKPKD